MNILEGRSEMLLPLANEQVAEQPMTLGHLIAMPAQQHMQLQVILMPAADMRAYCWDRSSAFAAHQPNPCPYLASLQSEHVTPFPMCSPKEGGACAYDDAHVEQLYWR